MACQEQERERPVFKVPPTRESILDDVEVAQTPPNRTSKRARPEKDATVTKVYYCRFCSMKFDNGRALGGHTNGHRKEKDLEYLQKFEALAGKYYGGTTWNMQGPGAGTLQDGGNLLPNSPAVGAFSRSNFAPNQSAADLQNWQMDQLSSPQQSSAYLLQSAPQASGGSYYDVHQVDNATEASGGSYYDVHQVDNAAEASGGGYYDVHQLDNATQASGGGYYDVHQLDNATQASGGGYYDVHQLDNATQASGGSYYDVHQLDNARPHPGLPSQTQAIGVHLPAHQQLRVNPGQHNMVQQMVYSDLEPVLQSGADIVGLQQPYGNPYHLNQAGPSTYHLESIVNMGSTANPQAPSNTALPSFMHRGSQSNIQFVDQYGNIPANSRLPPLNDAHFQQGQGQGHNFQDQQHYTPYEQNPGTLVMSSIESDAYNQAPGSGIRHMPSFQDSTGDQENYQGGNDQSSPVAEADLDGSSGIDSDGNSDGKSQH